METEQTAAADGERTDSGVLLLLRLAATVLMMAGDAWVVFEHNTFQQALDEVEVFVIGGKPGYPMVMALAKEWGVWPVIVSTAGVIAATIYIWTAARRVLPVILAAFGAASPCVVVAGTYQDATRGAWEWYADKRR